MRLTFVFFVLLALLSLTQSLYAAPTDGRWTIVYPCAGSTGGYAEKCSAGDRDHFTLQLWSQGPNLCGIDDASVQLGNHVDEAETESPSITGIVSGNKAEVTFEMFGAKGTASIEIKDDKLQWRLKTKDKGDIWGGVPNDAVLIKETGATSDQNLQCGPP